MSRSTRFAPALLALALLAACGGGERGANNEESLEAQVPQAQRYGGTATVGMIGDIPDVSPLTSTDYNGNQIDEFVLFMPLLRYDEHFQPQPWLAKSWEVNADTTLLTFHLRDDVYWQDGVKTTAADMKFTYDAARNPKTGFANTAFWTYYGDSEAPDSFTFRVKLRPHADFLDPWRYLAAAPEHILKDVPPEELRRHPFATRNPVGNGPFKFVARATNQSWTFAANERFPEELGGRPYLDRLVIRIIPEPTTLLTELLTGGLDYYIQPTPEQAGRIEASQNSRLVSFDDRAFVVLGWNERRPYFEDARVRRALTMAINREEIVKGVLYGYGKIANSTIPPFFWQYDPEAGAGLGYDTAQANRLLTEAGWVDRDHDGVRENPKGVPFRFTIKTNKGNQARADIAEKVQSDLKKVGIEATPRIVEWGTLLDQIQTPSRRDFDAVLIGWTTEFRIDDTDLFACSKLNEPFQWVGYCNPRTDVLMDTLPKIADRAAAKPLWAQYQRQIAEDQPLTILYFSERLEGVSNRLRNVHPDARGDFVGVKDWWILPNQRRESGAVSTR
jgi:peptide/nickel transport system substrate-binding protein